MDADAIAVLVTGAERRLLEPEVRRDPTALEDLLHESFREIGRSGRLWTRDELIDVMTGADSVDVQSAVVTGEHVELVAPGLAILTYSLYTFSAPNLPENHSMMLTIPFVIYGFFRYLYLVQVKQTGEAPEDILFSDRPIQANLVLWGLTILLIFYLS